MGDGEGRGEIQDNDIIFSLIKLTGLKISLPGSSALEDSVCSGCTPRV